MLVSKNKPYYKHVNVNPIYTQIIPNTDVIYMHIHHSYISYIHTQYYNKQTHTHTHTHTIINYKQ